MTLIFNTRPAMVMNHARAKKSSSKIRWCNSYEWNQSDWRTKKRTGPIFTALRCVSAVYAVVVCLSVCPSVRPSQAGIVSKRLERSSCFGLGVFRPPIPHCVIRKFGYFQKFVPNSGLGKFRSRCQEKSSSSTSQYSAASVPISAAE